MTDATKAKIAAAMIGHKISDATKAKISAAMRARQTKRAKEKETNATPIGSQLFGTDKQKKYATDVLHRHVNAFMRALVAIETSSIDIGELVVTKARSIEVLMLATELLVGAQSCRHVIELRNVPIVLVAQLSEGELDESAVSVALNLGTLLATFSLLTKRAPLKEPMTVDESRIPLSTPNLN